MSMHGTRATLIFVIVLAATGAVAGEVRNLNEFCLDYTLAKSDRMRAQLRDSTTEKNVLYQFRYLTVSQIQKDKPITGAFTLVTSEPGSDMRVVLVVKKSRSRALAAQLKKGEAVAGKGRIKRIGTPTPNTVLMDPAILKHKDRNAPKREGEFLKEVVPNAVGPAN